ncbi:hypothetical protein [Amycolatopsis minnesotensis]|uniref:hypothetical protein n=1 Tax=Amycolatopsis minnesotensis TaxID=337894 RepID=UPI0031D5E1F7
MVHHSLPVMEGLRVGFAHYVTAICTHLMLAARDLTSLMELMAALPTDDPE